MRHQDPSAVITPSLKSTEISQETTLYYLGYLLLSQYSDKKLSEI